MREDLQLCELMGGEHIPDEGKWNFIVIFIGNV